MATASTKQDSEFFSLSISPHIVTEKIIQAYVDIENYPEMNIDYTM